MSANTTVIEPVTGGVEGVPGGVEGWGGIEIAR